MARNPDRSTAETVRSFIEGRPVIREALSLGIVNYSALTRFILDETDLTSEEAVLVACRRYTPGPLPESHERPVRKALEASSLEIRTRVGTMSLEPSWHLVERLAQAMAGLRGDAERVHLLHGWEAITVVADERLLEELTRSVGKEHIFATQTGLAEVNVRAADPLSGVPGFIASLTGALAARGIRLVDAATCRRDHIFVIEEEDLTEAIDAIETLLNGND